MPRHPIGETAMTATERSRRRRDKARAMQDAATSLVDADIATVANGSSRYMHQAAKPSGDYPRMLYHADGRTVIAATAEQHEQLTADGWSTVPQKRDRPVSSYGVLGAVSDPLVETLRQVIRDEVRAVLREELDLHDLSGAGDVAETRSR